MKFDLETLLFSVIVTLVILSALLFSWRGLPLTIAVLSLQCCEFYTTHNQ